MKKAILPLLFLCVFTSLFSIERFSRKKLPEKVITQRLAPYSFGFPLIQGGYGVSIRTDVSKNTLELAPLFIPSSSGVFGIDSKGVGISCSYYYAFFQGALQPYLGLSYTYLRGLDRDIYWNSKTSENKKSSLPQTHLIAPVIGMQLFIGEATSPLSGYLFMDFFIGSEINKEQIRSLIKDFFHHDFLANPFIIPRLGVGLQF